ncbi:MAG: hypothetical protein ABR517_08375 [Thermoanaerobaculia bacterium]
MPSKTIHLETEGMSPEIELALRAVVAGLESRGAGVMVDGDRAGAGDDVVICAERNPTSFREAWRVAPEIENGLVRLVRGEDAIELPWSVVAPVASRRLPRAILAAGGSDSRRMRMMVRTAEELDRRRARCRFALWGPPPSPIAGMRGLDEIHTELSSDDLLRLLMSSCAVFDPAESPAEATALPWMGAAVGIAVVVAAEHPFAGGLRVAEWSPESFADVLERAVELEAPPGKPAVEPPAQRLLEAFGIDA